MAKAKVAEASKEITIVEVYTGKVEFLILGTSPLIFNAMSEKAKRQLLLPAPPKNRAEKATTLKHVPIDEYRNSVYRAREVKNTLLAFPAAAFKKSVASAALDIPGAAKSEISRLVWAEGDLIEIYGVPKVLCSIVRSADQARTPDVRTRAILPEWCCRVRMSFLKPNLNEKTLATLLSAAGMIRGIGDWRQEKGAGSYGQFRLASADDADYQRIMKTGGAKAQTAALEDPEAYDDETEKLLEWFDGERSRRSNDAPTKNGKAAAREQATA